MCQIEFDPGQVSLHTIMHVFFVVHDPTTQDKQGQDIGTQYRSVVFLQNESQQEIVQQAIEKAQDNF